MLDSVLAGEQAEAPVAACLKAVLAACASQVLEAKAGWPTELCKPLLTRVVSIQVVRAAFNISEELCDCDGSALPKALR